MIAGVSHIACVQDSVPYSPRVTDLWSFALKSLDLRTVRQAQSDLYLNKSRSPVRAISIISPSASVSDYSEQHELVHLEDVYHPSWAPFEWRRMLHVALTNVIDDLNDPLHPQLPHVAPRRASLELQSSFGPEYDNTVAVSLAPKGRIRESTVLNVSDLTVVYLEV